MTGQFMGMVVEDVESLGAYLLHEASDTLAHLVDGTSSRLAATHWVGSDFHKFRAAWEKEIAPQIMVLRERLESFGQYALQEAASQREASH